MTLLRNMLVLGAAATLAACNFAPKTAEGNAAGASAANGGVDAARIIAAQPAQWLSVGRTYDEQRFSPLDTINQGNVKDLGLSWFADLTRRAARKPRR